MLLQLKGKISIENQKQIFFCAEAFCACFFFLRIRKNVFALLLFFAVFYVQYLLWVLRNFSFFPWKYTSKRFKAIQNDSKWFKMIQSDSKWFKQMVSLNFLFIRRKFLERILVEQWCKWQHKFEEGSRVKQCLKVWKLTILNWKVIDWSSENILGDKI